MDHGNGNAARATSLRSIMATCVALSVAWTTVTVGFAGAADAPGVAEAACTTTWVGGSNGPQDVRNATNWSAGIPDAADVACVPAGVDIMWTPATTPIELGEIRIAPGGVVRLNSGTTRLALPSSIGGLLVTNGATLEFASTVTVPAGTVAVAGPTGTLRSTAAGAHVTVERFGSLARPEVDLLDLDTDVVNHGTFAVATGNIVRITAGRTVTNHGVVRVDGTARIEAASGATAAFRNEADGTVEAAGPAFVLRDCCAAPNIGFGNGVNLVNDGLVHVRSGELVLRGTATHTGGWLIGPDAQLHLQGAQTLAAGALLGDRVRTNATLTVGPDAVYAPAATDVLGGELALSGDRALGELSVTSGRLSSLGRVVLDGAVTTTSATIAVTSLWLPARRTWTMASGVTTLSATELLGDGELSMAGNLTLASGSVLRNRGTMSLTGSRVTIDATSSIDNQGRLLADAANVFGNAVQVLGNPGSVTNSGTMRISGGTFDFRAPLTNVAGGTLTGGRYEVADGSLWMFFPAITTLGATAIQEGSGRFTPGCCTPASSLETVTTITERGTLAVHGGSLNLPGAVTNAGTLETLPGSSVTVGTLTQAPTGRIRAGVGPSVTVGVIRPTTFVRGGTLEVFAAADPAGFIAPAFAPGRGAAEPEGSALGSPLSVVPINDDDVSGAFASVEARDGAGFRVPASFEPSTGVVNAGGMPIELSISAAPVDSVITEGGAARTVTVAFDIGNPNSEPVTVDWSVEPSTGGPEGAVIGDGAHADVRAAEGVVVLAPGQEGFSVPVEVLGDADHEHDEPFVITIGSPVAQGRHEIVLVDDDAAPQWTSAPIRVDEDGGSIVVPLNGSGRLGTVWPVATTIIEGVQELDGLRSLDGVVRVFGTDQRVAVPVGIVDDAVEQLNRNFAVRFEVPDVLSQAVEVIVLEDDVRTRARFVRLDGESEASAPTRRIAEGDGTAVTVELPVRVVGRPPTGDFTVSLTAIESDGTVLTEAVFGATSLTLPSGADEAVLTATFPADDVAGPDRRYEVAVTTEEFDGAGFGIDDGVIVIVEDDDRGLIDVADATVDEAAGSATLDVTISEAPAVPVTIPFSIEPGTAVEGNDYTVPAESTVTIPAGATGATITVPLVDDDRYDGTKTFTVRLGAASRGSVGDGVATVTVTDSEDPLPTIRFVQTSPVIIAEATAAPVTFNLVLDRFADVDLTYEVDTVSGIALEDEDFVGVHTTVTIPRGTTAASFAVPIIADDDDFELAQEEFAVTVRRDGDLLDAVTVRIVNDDATPRSRFVRQPGESPTVAISRTLNEGDTQPVTLLLPIELNQPFPDRTVRVDVTLLDSQGGTAADEGRVTVSAPFVDFAPGVTTASLTLTLQSDDVDQTDQEVIVALSPDDREPMPRLVDDTAVVRLVDDDDPVDPVDPSAGDELRAGIGEWFADWFGGAGTDSGFDLGFDLPNVDWPALGLPEVAPPVIPLDLGDLFDLDQLFAGVQLPGFDVNADTLDEIVADFDAVGCPADFVAGGIGGKPAAEPGDVIQVRCTRTLAQLLEQSGFAGADLNGATPDVLQGLAESVGLDADVAWSADAEVVLIAGLDADGFYVLGGSGVRLGVSGNGTVTGAGTVLGVQDAALDGAASADLTVGARMARDATERLRADDLAAFTPAGLVRTFDGTAAIDLTAQVADTTVTWNGDWTVASDATGRSDITTEQRVALRQELPGFAVGDVAAPTTIDLVGVLTERDGITGWAVSGTAVPAEGLELGGFTVTRLDAAGFVSSVRSDISVQVGLVIGSGVEAVTADVTLRVNGDGWAMTGSVAAERFTAGPIELDAPVLTVVASHATGVTDVTVSVAAAAGRLRTGGDAGGPGTVVAEMTGLTGEVTGDGDVTVTAATFTASIGDALDLSLTGAEVSTPGADGVVLSVATARAVAPGLGGLTVTITDLRVHADGRFSATSVAVEQPDGFARSIGLAGMIPVDLTALRLDFTNVDANGEVQDLSEFVVTVDGTVDLSGFAALPFDPVVQLGADVITPASPADERAISFSAFVQSTDPLVVTPLDLGPITLGMRDLTVGDVVLDAELRADGFAGGVLQPAIGGEARITGGIGTITGSVTASVDGAFVDGPTGTEVDATAVVGFSAAQRGGVVIEDLAATLSLRLGVDAGTPFLNADLDQVTLGSLRIPFGEFATVGLGDATLDLTPGGDADGLLFTIGGSLVVEGSGASIVFGDEFPAFEGWGGRVGGIGIDRDFQVVMLDGFFVDVTVPEGERFGLPDFVPVRIDEIGFALPPGVGPGDPLTDILADLQISVSGGLQGTAAFPVTATVDDLVVDLGRLADFDPLAPLDLATFPITNLSGVAFEVDPAIDLGVAKVSGSLRFGVVDVDGTEVLYARVGGLLQTPAFDAGADVVISQYGPVLIRVTAPLGIPLGPTGFVLTSVTGAAAFGDVTVNMPRAGQPEDLITLVNDLPTDASIDPAAIADALRPAVRDQEPTWQSGFALALEGRMTNVAAAGTLSGDVTLFASLRPGEGVRFVGRGQVEVFGIPLAEGLDIDGSLATAGIMIDFADPLAPAIDLAYISPSPGSPLAVAFPARTTVAGQLRTTGIATGVLAGVTAFTDTLSAATLARIAARLDRDRANPLAVLVRDADGSGSLSAAERAVTIDAALLRDRLVALLADPVRALSAVGPVITAISDDLGSLTPVQAQTELASFFATVADAAGDALVAAGDEFDPSFLFRGELQPTLLGIPVGDPTNAVQVTIDRTSLGFELTTSMIENLKVAIRQFPALGPIGESLVTAATLGGRDTVSVGVQVPVPGLTEIIIGGGRMPTLDSNAGDQNWSITLNGAFTVFGMQAQVSGFITSPGNQVLLDSKIEKRWLVDGTVPPNPDRVQIDREQDYENLLRYGGIVIDGRLEVPRLLTDPIGVTQDLPPLPEDLLGALGWFDQFGTVIAQTETPARVTLFIPGLNEVFEATDATREQRLQEWADAAVLTGVFEGTRRNPGDDPVVRLLSLPIGQGRILGTTAGIEVTADVPLIGAEGSFVLRVDERDGVRVPAGGLEVSMSSAELAGTLAELGLPDVFEVTGVDAEAGLRAYTPGFDPASTDPLRRRGGIAFDARLDAAGFVDGAIVDVLIDPIGTGAGPDFSAVATVDRIGPLGGVEIRNAQLSVVKAGTAVTVGVTGTATLFGSEWTVTGTLNPDLTGQLQILGAGGALPNVGGFEFVSGGFVLDVSRDAQGRLVGSVGLGGTVRLPTWLSSRFGNTEVSAAACIGSDGSSEIRLAVGRLPLDTSGRVRITGTGAPLAVSPDAPCTLPSNVLGMADTDARFLVRTVGGVTTVAVDGALQIDGSGLPAFTVSGALATDGTGTLTAAFGPNGLNLSGFQVSGSATLKLNGAAFSLDVDGRISVPGLVANAQVTGSITNTGIQQLTVATTGLNLQVVTITSSTLTLRRLAGGAYELRANATVTIPGVRRDGVAAATVVVDGAVATTGDYALAITGTGLTVAGAAVSGIVRLDKVGTTQRVFVDATFGLWGAALDVDGSLTLATGGVSGSLTLAMPGGLRLGGFAVGGSLGIAFSVTGTTNTATITLTNGTVTVPGIGTLNATASVSTSGTGFIQVATPGGLRIGGATSPFFGVGSFRLSFAAGVVTFSAANAGLEYRDGATVVFGATIPNFTIASNGSLSVTTNGFTLGSPTGLRIVVPPASLTANANGALLRLNLPAATLTIPGLADGATGRPAITTPALSIDTGQFRYVLFDARTINLGLMRLNGRLVFERPAGGAFRLAVEGNANGAANIDLGELGRVEFPAFFVQSNGDFDVTATTNRIGTTNPLFEIRDASFRFRRAAGTVTLAINGGDLRVPSLSAPIELPNLSITLADTFTRDIDLPGLDLGPFFQSDAARFRLTIERTRARFELREDITGNDPSVTAFAGSTSMTLRELLIDSNGIFRGEVTGRLSLFGQRISQATFQVDLSNGLLRLTLPASAGETLDLGFVSFGVSGTARSDGVFSFTGSAATAGSIPFVGPSWNGRVTMTVANAGISGSYSGNVSFAGLSAQSSGSVSPTGRVTGTVRVDLNGDGSTGGFTTCFIGCSFTSESAAFAFDLIPGIESPDTTDPVMAQPANKTVATSQTTGSIPVYYTQPTATDNRDGTLNPRCTPGSGTLFAVGQTTTVTCTARDAAGNTRTREFTVTVNVALSTVIVSGNTVSSTFGGFGPGTVTSAAVFSDPVALAQVTADANGRASYVLEIPRSLPAGTHHITVVGVGPDGGERLWVVPIEIAADGTLASVDAQLQVPAPEMPSTRLPATGGTPADIVRWALACLFVGAVLLLLRRKRSAVS